MSPFDRSVKHVVTNKQLYYILYLFGIDKMCLQIYNQLTLIFALHALSRFYVFS